MQGKAFVSCLLTCTMVQDEFQSVMQRGLRNRLRGERKNLQTRNQQEKGKVWISQPPPTHKDVLLGQLPAASQCGFMSQIQKLLPLLHFLFQGTLEGATFSVENNQTSLTPGRLDFGEGTFHRVVLEGQLPSTWLP